MATISLQIVSGAGTTTVSKTFSASDATRIIDAFKKLVNATGTQQDLTNNLGAQVLNYLSRIVQQAETVIPAPPNFT